MFAVTDTVIACCQSQHCWCFCQCHQLIIAFVFLGAVYAVGYYCHCIATSWFAPWWCCHTLPLLHCMLLTLLPDKAADIANHWLLLVVIFAVAVIPLFTDNNLVSSFMVTCTTGPTRYQVQGMSVGPMAQCVKSGTKPGRYKKYHIPSLLNCSCNNSWCNNSPCKYKFHSSKKHLPVSYAFSDCATPLCHVQVHTWSRNLVLLELGVLAATPSWHFIVSSYQNMRGLIRAHIWGEPFHVCSKHLLDSSWKKPRIFAAMASQTLW